MAIPMVKDFNQVEAGVLVWLQLF